MVKISRDELVKLVKKAVDAALLAGIEIIDVYHSDFSVEHKEDASPLTLADQRAHLKIVAQLQDIGLPILSEEGKELDYEERKDWNPFWCVDPLDGTKEFVKRNGEFTVNIALIEDRNPILGVVYAPINKWLYFGGKEIGSYKIENVDTDKILAKDTVGLFGGAKKLPLDAFHSQYVVVASRSHLSEETKTYIDDLENTHGKVEMISMGSSLKICLVAEGTANEYPRFAPTMEWDTAAGQAICEGANKKLIDYESDQSMIYNRKNLRNNWFIVK